MISASVMDQAQDHNDGGMTGRGNKKAHQQSYPNTKERGREQQSVERLRRTKLNLLW